MREIDIAARDWRFVRYGRRPRGAGIRVGIQRPVIQQGDEEVEVGEWKRCDGFHQDVDHNIGVV